MENKLKLNRFVVAKLNNTHLIYGGGEGENQESLNSMRCSESALADTCTSQTEPTTTGDPGLTGKSR